MKGETSFLDFLREAPAGEPRGNDELVRAVAPLFLQVLEHHDEGRVAPLVGVDRIYADGGHLWFRDAEALAPRVNLKAVRSREPNRDGGMQVVDRTTITVDLEAHSHTVTSGRVAREEGEIAHPLYVPDYMAWEDGVDHHDALTDIFSLGMITASLALGADFTEPDELEHFVRHRHTLTALNASLHPVIAKAIVRMTELDRRLRAQDLRGLCERLERYREVDERVDSELDFRSIKGFVQADRTSRRKLIQAHLQSRLFDTTRRNRLIWYRPTLSTLDLTEASVPTQLSVDNVQPEDLFLWHGAVRESLSELKPLRVDRYVRFEETPYVRGSLDTIRAQARRDEAELGASQLRVVVAFLNWHNLRDAPQERIRSPLLLLPVKLERKRGVRDSYVLTPTSDVAEVNPVLRHLLQELYDLELPERIELSETDLSTFHRAVAAEVTRSEPGITVHLLERPQIRLVHERARRRLATWRRRSKVSGRGVRRLGDVSYSYTRANFRPLGLQLFLSKVKPERLAFEAHFEHAQTVHVESPVDSSSDREGPQVTEPVKETSRSAYQVIEEATGRFDWAVDLTHITLGNFNYRKMSLVRDYDEILEEDEGQDHAAFDLMFSLDARELDAPPVQGSDPFEPFVVVPADPTQTAALHWARKGKNFIIQGPPGTGKSQTITNLIADFAGRGKRVLFVCEKRAALDVVYHRLAQHGLDELSVLIHDSQSDKKPFLTELGSTYERWLAGLEERAGEQERQRREALGKELTDPLSALSRFNASMTRPAVDSRSSVSALLRERLRHGPGVELSAEDAERIPTHRSFCDARADVQTLASALEEVGESAVLSETALLWLNPRVLSADRPIATLREGLDAIDSELSAIDEARELVRPGATATELREAHALAEEVSELADAGQLSLLDPSSESSRRLSEKLSLRDARARLVSKAREKTFAWNEKLPRADLAPALDMARRFDAMFILLLIFLPSWWHLRGVLKRHYDFRRHTVQPRWLAVLSELSTEYAGEDELTALTDEISHDVALGGTLEEKTARLDELRGTEGRTPLQLELRAEWSAGNGDVVQALRAAGKHIAALSGAVEQVFDGASAITIDELADRIQRTRAAVDLLPELRAPLSSLADAGADVRSAMRALPLTAQQLEATVADVTLERTFRGDRPLLRFDHQALGRRQTQLRQRYGDWMAANAAAVREGVRARFLEHVRVCATPAGSLTPEQKALKKTYNAGRRVLEREFKKVMRHRSIRELSSGDSGTVLYDLKPIWLMSPLSISDTIPLGEERFDVVIFDEASQIPLEEAVPALHRAPQMIVVGDEMQLPPTNFFAGKRDTAGDAEEGESHYDLDADSFLSHAARRLPSTMLGWHYRSRSEALIRFSNFAFYDGKLLTVPDRGLEARREPIVVSASSEGGANAARVVDRPVSFHRVSAGLYAGRRNGPEATYIAHLVRGLLAEGCGHTIGIVAFSEAQQGEIESALGSLARSDEAFGAALEAEYERMEEGQMVGLFVKNLENVQGDERDIIILSICYGPDANGKMRMNFGPINKGGGEKRLNVVFSRAKRHMAVVSSIGYAAITNEYNEGARCFRRYLQYAEAVSRGDAETANVVTRALEHSAHNVSTPGEPDLVVEQLAEALTERGYVVRRDIGSSDFQVDVALCREGDGELRLGVLVDTDGHYERGTPMERYHARPAVLEAFGWQVQWVLAKDWVADPQACLRRIDEAYRAAAVKPQVAPSETALEEREGERQEQEQAPSVLPVDVQGQVERVTS